MAVDELDLLPDDQVRHRDRLLRIAGVVLDHDLDLAAIDAAGVVDRGGGGFRAALHLVADRGDRARSSGRRRRWRGRPPGPAPASADRATPASDRTRLLRMIFLPGKAARFAAAAALTGAAVGKAIARNRGDGNRAAKLRIGARAGINPPPSASAASAAPRPARAPPDDRKALAFVEAARPPVGFVDVEFDAAAANAAWPPRESASASPEPRSEGATQS